jgi:hypothetical protein
MADCLANRAGRIRSGVLNLIPAVIKLHAALAALVQFGAYDALHKQERVFGERKIAIALFQRDVSISAVWALSAAPEPESN